VLPGLLLPDRIAHVKKNAPRCLKFIAGSWRRWPCAPVRAAAPALRAPVSSSICRSYLTE
jgi:hypothetical protein